MRQNFLKGQGKLQTSAFTEENFEEQVQKYDIQRLLDSYGDYTYIDLFLGEDKNNVPTLAIEYRVFRPTISECRMVAKRIKADFANRLNCKFELVMDMEGKTIR